MLAGRGGCKNTLSFILALLLSFSLLAVSVDSLLGNIGIGKSSQQSAEEDRKGNLGAGGSENCKNCQGSGSNGGDSPAKRDAAERVGETGKRSSESNVEVFGTTIPVEGCLNNSHTPLFEVHGSPRTAYLRTSVGEVYRSGSWDILDTSSRVEYRGGAIEQAAIGYSKASYVKFRIEPLVAIKGFIPSVKNSVRLSLPEDGYAIHYYPSQQIFFSESSIRSGYGIEYVSYEFDERDLMSGSVPIELGYLDVPKEMLPALRPLAQKIVETYRADTPYEKLKAIEHYLKENYVYDKNYTRPPSSQDPILWFLFTEKRGVCIHFNSAFVLLARSIGIPARLVTGFYIEPEREYQVVYADQAHAYAEALFNGLGWITFDATGGPADFGKEICKECERRGDLEVIKTTTEITHVDDLVIKGSTFKVLGKVLDERGFAVSGLLVKVYLKHSKSDKTGILVGQGVVEKGIFNITCSAPPNVTVGKYSVIAETVGGGRYLGSQSDPEIRVIAKTYISASYPEKVIAGRVFSISGYLRELVSDLPVENKVITLVYNSREYRNLTDNTGRFSFELMIAEPGNYTLTLNFGGDENYLGSTSELRLRVLSLIITPLTNSTLLRGEKAEISGIIHAENLPGDNEVVLIYKDGIQVAKVKSDAEGRFRVDYYVPKDHTLGKSVFRYKLQSNGFETVQEVKVMARSWMTVKPPEEPLENGRPFTISLTLLNDLNEPISNAPIILNCTYQGHEYSASNNTNEKGEAIFNLTLSVDRDEFAIYKLIFPGNELYLGTELVGDLKVAKSNGFPAYLAFLLIAAIAACGFVAKFMRSKSFFQDNCAVKERNAIQEFGSAKNQGLANKKGVELAIKFPSIMKPFPPVWGLNENLTVRVEIRKDGMPVRDAPITLKVDEREIQLKSLPSGEAEVQLTFNEKGVHRLIAYFSGNGDLNEATAEAAVRIVDYREEIVDLFNSFIKSAIAVQRVKENMTAREIQQRLLNDIPENKRSYLEEMVSIFELADYSLRQINRLDYEKFFFAKLIIEGWKFDEVGQDH